MVKTKTTEVPSISIPVDITFIVDATGSMGHFIQQAKTFLINSMSEIESISDILDIRYSLILYRDHPPEDHTFASKILVKVSNVSDLKKGMNSIHFTASGGGDEPESGLDAIADISQLKLRNNSLRYAFLVGDAPLHGTNYQNTNIPCKCGLTSAKIRTVLEKENITLFALSISGNRQCILSFQDITQNVISTNTGTNEITKSLQNVCTNAVWSVSKVLPVLRKDKYAPLTTIAELLEVSVAQISAAIESLNILGLTQNI